MLDLARKARRSIHGKRTANVDQITGKTLLALGYKPGGWFGAAIAPPRRAARAPAKRRSAPPSTGTCPLLPRRCVPRVRWPIG